MQLLAVRKMGNSNAIFCPHILLYNIEIFLKFTSTHLFLRPDPLVTPVTLLTTVAFKKWRFQDVWIRLLNPLNLKHSEAKFSTLPNLSLERNWLETCTVTFLDLYKWNSQFTREIWVPQVRYIGVTGLVYGHNWVEGISRKNAGWTT
jgi:hypothetical protein